MSSAVTRILTSALDSVLPHTIIRKHLIRQGGTLLVGKESYKLRQNVHIIGFGKAVSGMCRGVQDILTDHIVNGILSVPTGTLATFRELGKSHLLPVADGKVSICEGAANNLPDEASYETTIKIIRLLENSDRDDIFITLISGGGSALLCAPIPPVSLQDKLKLTTLLAKSGATIDELNTVRKAVSMVKGGGLAKLAYPSKMITLILSDVIGDPLDMIASGPTVQDECSFQDRINILEKYNLMTSIHSTVQTVLKESNQPSVTNTASFSYVQNILVGSNAIAVNAAVAESQSHGYETFVISKQLNGEARDVGRFFINLVTCVKKIIDSKRSPDLKNEIEIYKDELLKKYAGFNWPWLCETNHAIQNIFMLAKEGKLKKICVIGAGETTVSVTGHGIGGRNQEMVLAAAIHFYKMGVDDFSDIFISFLSAGTDGQDGPTDAAGAIFSSSNTIIKTDADLIKAEKALENNDSYNFLKNSDALLKTGLTGTNVMDLQILTLEFL